eukprot:TRINITY_DN94626_c0_g1_i1.p1 TRINITY_DN94626_c0_g1~~TRINITY_DN94626_c0_g1_i1.p1  ORF type:complete len:760 (+),score=89.27 TRINITY_DN94626_c0_g1_i1:55-2334(+)
MPRYSVTKVDWWRKGTFTPDSYFSMDTHHPSFDEIVRSVPRGSMWTDPSIIPLTDSSATWSRPADIWPNSEVAVIKSEDGDHYGADLSDVNQGAVGDCWFMAALASCAKLNRVRDIIGRSDPDRGVYEIHLFSLNSAGKPEPFSVCVDNRLPHRKGSRRPLYVASDEPGELWPSLIEKAFAKVIRSQQGQTREGYPGMKGGLQAIALVHLLGGNAFLMLPEEPNGNFPSDKLRAEIRRILAENGALGLCWKPSGAAVGPNGEPAAPDGLVANHAYSLLRVQDVTLNSGEQLTLVQLRNPWGELAAGNARLEWTGRWSDGDSRWDQNPDARRACDFSNKKDGLMWMDLKDACKLASLLEVWQPDPNYRKPQAPAAPSGGGGSGASNKRHGRFWDSLRENFFHGLFEADASAGPESYTQGREAYTPNYIPVAPIPVQPVPAPGLWRRVENLSDSEEERRRRRARKERERREKERKKEKKREKKERKHSRRRRHSSSSDSGSSSDVETYIRVPIPQPYAPPAHVEYEPVQRRAPAAVPQAWGDYQSEPVAARPVRRGPPQPQPYELVEVEEATPPRTGRAQRERYAPRHGDYEVAPARTARAPREYPGYAEPEVVLQRQPRRQYVEEVAPAVPVRRIPQREYIPREYEYEVEPPPPVVRRAPPVRREYVDVEPLPIRREYIDAEPVQVPVRREFVDIEPRPVVRREFYTAPEYVEPTIRRAPQSPIYETVVAPTVRAPLRGVPAMDPYATVVPSRRHSWVYD